jgi:hypothetical protein
VSRYVLFYLIHVLKIPLEMDTPVTLHWSTAAKKVPDKVNSQLVGTYPSIVTGEDGMEKAAFFVRVSAEEWSAGLPNKAKCMIRPQFVRTPQGPMVVAYCMVAPSDSEPFISETAIFPRLSSMPTHREIAELLMSKGSAFLTICNEKGDCLFNSKARILTEWRSELIEKSKAFDEGKQISDEKAAIMSLYWYQERYNPSSKIFEVRH